MAEFFGSMNWLRGTVLDKHCVETAIGRLEVDYRGKTNGSVVVGIRPEDMKIDASHEILRNRIEGTMVHSTFVGDQIIFEIRMMRRC